MAIQEQLRKLHVWLGVAFGVFVVIMGITRCVSVSRIPIERAQAPRVSAAGPVRLVLVEQSFAASHPGASISRFIIGMSEGEALPIEAETAGSGARQR